MLIGILSDSHGAVLAVRRAMEIFDAADLSLIIHCGDIGGTSVFEELIDRPLRFVWGNCDPADELEPYVRALGFTVPVEIPTVLELEGTRIAVFHGHEREFYRAEHMLDVDYILHGHTHKPRNEQCNGKRIINPGALYRARRKCVAILDTESGELTFHDIKVP